MPSRVAKQLISAILYIRLHISARQSASAGGRNSEIRRTSSVGSVLKLCGAVSCDFRESGIPSASDAGRTVGESHLDETSIKDWFCLRLRARRDNQVHTIL
jgi:hypothetical protein